MMGGTHEHESSRFDVIRAVKGALASGCSRAGCGRVDCESRAARGAVPCYVYAAEDHHGEAEQHAACCGAELTTLRSRASCPCRATSTVASSGKRPSCCTAAWHSSGRPHELRMRRSTRLLTASCGLRPKQQQSHQGRYGAPHHTAALSSRLGNPPCRWPSIREPRRCHHHTQLSASVVLLLVASVLLPQPQQPQNRDQFARHWPCE